MQDNRSQKWIRPSFKQLFGVSTLLGLPFLLFAARKAAQTNPDPAPDVNAADRDAARADAAFEWHKAEHGTLSKHFEAVWQSGALNFSYMAVASAAILTFAGNRFQLDVTLVLAWLPIGVWFLVTYLPFAAYASHVRTRLSSIEKEAATHYGTSEGHFAGWNEVVMNKREAPLIRTGFGVARAILLIATLFAFLPIIAKTTDWTWFNEVFEHHIKAPEKTPADKELDQRLSRMEATLRDLKLQLDRSAAP